MSGRDLPPELAVSAAAVGRMIRLSREARGWSATELARRTGVAQDRVRVGRMEKGERLPSWWFLVRMSCALYPYDDELVLRAARRLAAVAGPALVADPPSGSEMANGRAFRLAYPQGLKNVVAWTSGHRDKNHGGS